MGHVDFRDPRCAVDARAVCVLLVREEGEAEVSVHCSGLGGI